MSARPPSYFPDNVARLFGLYRLTGSEAAQALGFSRQAVSEWQSGKTTPNLATLYSVADFFEIEPDTLMRRPFIEWASDYLSDHERFEALEKKVEPLRGASGRAARHVSAQSLREIQTRMGIRKNAVRTRLAETVEQETRRTKR
jgi:transcriptional regulator with XRE-family HTH domain